ncbi:MAG: D-2-hydroxyacid dehydrogenase [Planctomycetaceae bacterium]|nr:D-2-hydroxyacid dehydrogenase [Planctomycetaceae bacterium]|tara:strand:+ start:5460 stop:6461 length:1002 start_codon:yes stop_codon:yes gene_type:complete
MKLVIHPPVDDVRLERICEAAGEMAVVNAANPEEAAAEIIDATAFFGKITPELLSVAGQLEWVQAPTASLEHYVFDELVAHPCTLTNMRGLYYDVIADHVMGYVLVFARNLHKYLRQQIDRTWAPVGGEEERSDFVSGPGWVSGIDAGHLHLADCTMGVVGTGSIGAEICRRAASFGMEVLGVDPVATSVPGVVDDVWGVDRVDELLGASDFVVIAAPHTPETEGWFETERFAAMKKTAYFINIGRGAIVKLDALTEALESGAIAGAALDVYETEPLPVEHPLWRLENVLLTPHIAAASPRIAERHLATLLENVACYVAGEDLVTVADKTRWF